MNTIVFNMDYWFIRDVVLKLDNENIINIKGWFINARTFREKVSLKKAVFWPSIVYGEAIYEYLYDIPDNLYSTLYNRFSIYLDQLVRESYFENRTVPENIGVINIFIHYFYDLLFGEKVDLIIFADVPHGAFALILYDIAKELGIHTLILLPFYIRDKFIFCWDLEDIGLYKKNQFITNINDRKQTDIFGHYEKDVFWEPKKKKPIADIFERFKDSIREAKFKYDDNYDYITRHIVRSIVRKYRNYIYNKHNKKIFHNKINNQDKFVYFPLHLQPEATTSTLGKEYHDQILAIERTLKIIPDDWYVYVKEYPLQTYAWRDKYFYARLRSLKRVKCVEGSTNTYELIKKSQFVSTITGTAGFEAISGGKPALVFGLAWYRSLPGVTIYAPETTLNDVMKPFTTDDVEEAFKTVEQYFVDGIVHEEIFEYANNLDVYANQRKVFNFLKSAVASCKPLSN